MSNFPIGHDAINRRIPAWIGVDPGKTGAACLLSKNAQDVFHAEFMDWPDTLYEVKAQLLLWRSEFLIKQVVMERVASMHGQGVKSVFTFGVNKGHWEMALTMMNFPVYQPTPQEWMKAVGIKPTDGASPKERIQTFVMRQFPQFRSLFFGPKGGYKDGRGDALGIAYFAYMRDNK